jgi:hypothetical protein
LEEVKAPNPATPENLSAIPAFAPVQPKAGPDKMSVKAIAGAVSTGLGLCFWGVAIPGFFLVAYHRTGPQTEVASSDPGVLAVVVIALAILPSMAGPLLGATALGDIRRSGGRLRGLPLALFAAYCLPLLLFDAVFVWTGSILLGGLITAAWDLIRLIPGRARTFPSVLAFAPLAMAVLLSLVIDFLVVRATWRWAQGRAP